MMFNLPVAHRIPEYSWSHLKPTHVDIFWGEDDVIFFGHVNFVNANVFMLQSFVCVSKLFY